ncbi:UNVERIFIED_CONTAM: hypothetical protein PYX00_002873 [Menopon gallinae]|uniref:Uncharacterized protein n=1 Tax=Menopon gallinae TaxID=328185 RepID=A0AAW2HXV4_9NEOP
MRRCAKCRKEELARLQKEQEEAQQQLQHHRSVEQQTDGAIAVIQTPDSVDCTSPSTTNTTFYNLDPPGPGGTYCEIHGYIPPKEGNCVLRRDRNLCPPRGLLPQGPIPSFITINTPEILTSISLFLSGKSVRRKLPPGYVRAFSAPPRTREFQRKVFPTFREKLSNCGCVIR